MHTRYALLLSLQTAVQQGLSQIHFFFFHPAHFEKLSALFNKDYKPWLPQPLQIFIDFNFHTYNCWAYAPKHRRLRSVIPYYLEQGMHMDERALQSKIIQNRKGPCEDRDVGIWQWQAAGNGQEKL